MDNKKLKTQLSTITKITAIVAILVSGLWLLFIAHNKQLNDQNTLSYLDKIKTLEQHLKQRSSHEHELLSKYGEALEGNVSLEKSLAKNTTKLKYLEESLSVHHIGDWENKYLQEKNSNKQIFESMTQQEEEIELLKEEQEVLTWKHKRNLEMEHNEHLEQINTLKSKLLASTKANKKKKKKTPPAVSETEVKTKNPSNYRSARMLSLINNTNGLSSQKKLNILIKVIPTVPEGITTNELTKLASGMDSEDVLSLIETSERYIQKIKNKKLIALLLSKMSISDASIASKILVN